MLFYPALLNMHSIPYSGNPLEAMFITTSKALTSKTLVNAGINNPEFFFPSQHSHLRQGKSYILKPIWEDGSLGITADSVFVYGQGMKENLLILKTHTGSSRSILTEGNSI